MFNSGSLEWIHQCDPRFKLLVLFLVVIQIFVSRNTMASSLTGLEILTWMLIAKVPVRLLAKRLRSILWFGLILVGVNALTQSGQVLFGEGTTIVTLEGIERGVYLTLNIALLILASSTFLYCTSMTEILDALESAAAIGPKAVQPLTIILSMTLSFSPMMVSAAQHLRKAHQARGIDVDSGWLKKARFVTAAAFPLFAHSFRSAQHLAMAVEARCYDPDVRRTPFRRLRLGRDDLFGVGIAVLIFVIVISVCLAVR